MGGCKQMLGCLLGGKIDATLEIVTFVPSNLSSMIDGIKFCV